MVHEPLGAVGTDGVQGLSHAQRAHRHDGQDLSFAAGEQSRAVGAGQDAGVAGDWADLVQCPSVRPYVLLQDAASHGLSEYAFETIGDGVAGVFLAQLFGHFGRKLFFPVVHLVHAGVPAEQVVEPGADDLFDLGGEGVGPCLVVFGVELGFAHLTGQVFNHVDGAVVGLLGPFDGFQDYLFRDIIGAGFHHQDCVSGAADHHAQLALFALLIGRVNDVFALQIGDAA